MTRLRHPYIVPLRYAFQTEDKVSPHFFLEIC